MAKESGVLAPAFFKGAATAVGAAAGAAGIAWLMGWLSPVWSFAQDAFKSLWTHLIAQSQWPNWSAYLVSLAAAIAALRWFARYWRNRKDNHNRLNELRLLGAVWRWNGMSSLPYGLRPYCQTCDLMLVYSETHASYYANQEASVELVCERCNRTPTRELGSMQYLRERVCREIERLVRTGEWRQHVP